MHGANLFLFGSYYYYIMRDFPGDSRRALTKSMRDRIKYAANHRCEYCGRYYDNNILHVHHISEVHLADGRYDVNDSSNLIVLCANCHGNAHNGRIPDAVLHQRIYNRDPYVRRLIDEAVEDRQIIVEEQKKEHTTLGLIIGLTIIMCKGSWRLARGIGHVLVKRARL